MIEIGKKTKLALIGSSVFSLGLIGFWVYFSSFKLTTEDAYVEGDLHPVNARMMGFVKEIKVEENAEVHKGDHLLKLDDVDTLIELNFKRAKLKKAKADFARAEKLREAHAISASDFEMAQATLAGISAEVEGAELKLRFTDVVSPVDGIVAKKSAQVGQFIQPGQSLFVIVTGGSPWIKANFKESEIRMINPGQKVKITAESFPGQSWDGKVESVFPTSVASLSLIPPENATGNFTRYTPRFSVKISFQQDENARLRPGMTVNPTIMIGR